MDLKPFFQQGINDIANYLETHNAPGIIKIGVIVVIAGILIVPKILSLHKRITRKIHR